MAQGTSASDYTPGTPGTPSTSTPRRPDADNSTDIPPNQRDDFLRSPAVSPTKAKKFKSAMTKREKHEVPDWDGVYGRTIQMLPPQNRFKWRKGDVPIGSGPGFPPESPKEDPPLDTSIECDFLDDETLPKEYKSQLSKPRAGGVARMRLGEVRGRPYQVTDQFGSTISEKFVIFGPDFNTEEKRERMARGKLVELEKQKLEWEDRQKLQQIEYEKA